MNELVTIEEIRKYLRYIILSGSSLDVREFALDLLLKTEKMIGNGTDK